LKQIGTKYLLHGILFYVLSKQYISNKPIRKTVLILSRTDIKKRVVNRCNTE